MRNIDLIANGYKILQLRNALREKGTQSFANRKKNLLNNFETVFKNYDINVDKAVFEQAINYYAKTMPKALLSPNLHQFDAHALADKLYKESFLASKAEMDKVLNLPDDAFEKRLKNDVGVQFVDQIIAHFYETVMPTYQNLGSEIAALQRTYMKAILEFSKPQDRIFPDANSTLRVTYGKVTGYSPSDAVTYDYITYLDGVMEKYVPNDYEFDVPAKLRELYEKKDYGIYGVNGKMPVCFIATNHTTGGNSGSPAIDAQGNLIGLNFDRVWEGTMSDIHYDPKICRNIMVDIRYVLFIIDKYAGAGYLLNEMKLVK